MGYVTHLSNSLIAPYDLTKWRVCNLADNGTVNAYYGDAGFTEDGSNGQVMVEMHKAFYKTTYDGTVYTWQLSEKQEEGFKLYPAFLDGDKVCDKIYFSTYEGCIQKADNSYEMNDANVFTNTASITSGMRLSSIAGAKPCSGVGSQELTIVNARTIAKNRGAGWYLQDFLASSLIQMAMLINQGTFNSQGVLSNGVVNINDTTAGNTLNNSVITGLTTALGNSTGQVNYTYTYPNLTTVVTNPFRFFGIENFYGNIWTFVDGININNNVPYICYNPTNYASDVFSGNYVNTGVTLSNIDGWASDIVYSDSLDFSFLIKSVSASATILYDYYFQASGARVALLGGAWHSGSSAGARVWHLGTYSASRIRNIGCRLLYKKGA